MIRIKRAILVQAPVEKRSRDTLPAGLPALLSVQSPVGTIAAVCTIRMTVRCGAEGGA